MSGQLLDVGVSCDVRLRYKQHALDKDWWPRVTVRDAEWFPCREEALSAERAAIKSERPRFNKRHVVKTKKPREQLRILKGKVTRKGREIYQSVERGMRHAGYTPEQASAAGRRWERAYKARDS